MLTVKDGDKVVWGDIPLAELAKGNYLDSYFTLKIYNILNQEYKNDKQRKLFTYLINPLLPKLAKMEYNGLRVCLKKHKELGKKLDGQIMEVEDVVYANSTVKGTDNLASGDSLAEILYGEEDDGRAGLFPPDWTDGNKPSTSKPTLNILLEQIDEELENRAR